MYSAKKKTTRTKKPKNQYGGVTPAQTKLFENIPEEELDEVWYWIDDTLGIKDLAYDVLLWLNEHPGIRLDRYTMAELLNDNSEEIKQLIMHRLEQKFHQ